MIVQISSTKWRTTMNITFKSVLKYTGVTLVGVVVLTALYQLAKEAPLPEGAEEAIDEVLNNLTK